MPTDKQKSNKGKQKNGTLSGGEYKVGPGKPPLETRFSSEHQPANSGRKPSLLKKYIIDNGISIQDVRIILKGLIMDNTVSELMKISDDETEPMMTRTVIKAYLKDFEAGRIDTLNSILDRVYGKADQSIGISGSLATHDMTPEELDKRIDELEQKRKGK